MTDTKLLCQYIQEDDIASMKRFLEANPDSPLVNGRCNIKNLVSLGKDWFGNSILADNVFGTDVPLLLFATIKNNEPMMHVMVENSNVVEIDPTSIYGDTPLMVEALYGKFNGAKLFLDHGANVKLGDEHDYTPLHKVALGYHFRKTTETQYVTKDYINTAELLLSYNADINAIAHGDGQPDGTPLDMAIFYENFDMVNFLVQNGADTTMKGEL